MSSSASSAFSSSSSAVNSPRFTSAAPFSKPKPQPTVSLNELTAILDRILDRNQNDDEPSHTDSVDSLPPLDAATSKPRGSTLAPLLAGLVAKDHPRERASDATKLLMPNSRSSGSLLSALSGPLTDSIDSPSDPSSSSSVSSPYLFFTDELMSENEENSTVRHRLQNYRSRIVESLPVQQQIRFHEELAIIQQRTSRKSLASVESSASLASQRSLTSRPKSVVSGFSLSADRWDSGSRDLLDEADRFTSALAAQAIPIGQLDSLTALHQRAPLISRSMARPSTTPMPLPPRSPPPAPSMVSRPRQFHRTETLGNGSFTNNGPSFSNEIRSTSALLATTKSSHLGPGSYEVQSATNFTKAAASSGKLSTFATHSARFSSPLKSDSPAPTSYHPVAPSTHVPSFKYSLNQRESRSSGYSVPLKSRYNSNPKSRFDTSPDRFVPAPPVKLANLLAPFGASTERNLVKARPIDLVHQSINQQALLLQMPNDPKFNAATFYAESAKKDTKKTPRKPLAVSFALSPGSDSAASDPEVDEAEDGEEKTEADGEAESKTESPSDRPQLPRALSRRPTMGYRRERANDQRLPSAEEMKQIARIKAQIQEQRRSAHQKQYKMLQLKQIEKNLQLLEKWRNHPAVKGGKNAGIIHTAQNGVENNAAGNGNAHSGPAAVERRNSVEKSGHAVASSSAHSHAHGHGHGHSHSSPNSSRLAVGLVHFPGPNSPADSVHSAFARYWLQFLIQVKFLTLYMNANYESRIARLTQSTITIQKHWRRFQFAKKLTIVKEKLKPNVWKFVISSRILKKRRAATVVTGFLMNLSRNQHYQAIIRSKSSRNENWTDSSSELKKILLEKAQELRFAKLHTAMERIRASVIKIQRWWRSRMVLLRARVYLHVQYWNFIENCEDHGISSAVVPPFQGYNTSNRRESITSSADSASPERDRGTSLSATAPAGLTPSAPASAQVVSSNFSGFHRSHSSSSPTFNRLKVRAIERLHAKIESMKKKNPKSNSGASMAISPTSAASLNSSNSSSLSSGSSAVASSSIPILSFPELQIQYNLSRSSASHSRSPNPFSLTIGGSPSDPKVGRRSSLKALLSGVSDVLPVSLADLSVSAALKGQLISDLLRDQRRIFYRAMKAYKERLKAHLNSHFSSNEQQIEAARILLTGHSNLIEEDQDEYSKRNPFPVLPRLVELNDFKPLLIKGYAIQWLFNQLQIPEEKHAAHSATQHSAHSSSPVLGPRSPHYALFYSLLQQLQRLPTPLSPASTITRSGRSKLATGRRRNHRSGSVIEKQIMEHNRGDPTAIAVAEAAERPHFEVPERFQLPTILSPRRALIEAEKKNGEPKSRPRSFKAMAGSPRNAKPPMEKAPSIASSISTEGSQIDFDPSELDF